MTTSHTVVHHPPCDSERAVNLPQTGEDAPGSDNLIGARVLRSEDPQILTGRTQYIDDVVVPGMLESAVLRSPHPNARIVGIDTTRALELPGVHAIVTGSDIVSRCDQQPVIWQMIPGQFIPEHYAMATDQARWVGQPVAAVAADNRYLAEDAIALIDVEYEILPPVGDLDTALSADGPRVWEGHDNVSGMTTVPKGDADAAFEEAEVIVRTTLDYGRQMGTPLETRGCVATWDPFTDELDIWTGSQAPNLARDLLSDVLRIPVDKIRVRVPRLGGGFGNKFDFYAEDVIASVLSRSSGRPVKLIEDRAESFVATVHSRNQRLDVEMAATRDGRITAIRGTVYQVLGAVLGTVGVGPAWASTAIMTGPYDIPNASVTLKAVLTNRPPYGSYRGWGQPKGCFAHERLIEALAREIGKPANEIRRINLIREFPYLSQVFLFDSGDYLGCLEQAESAVAELGWPEQVAQMREQGRSVGIGYGFHVEITAFGPSRIMNAAGLQHATFDEEIVRMDSSGGVTVYTGQIGMGQGVETALAQVAAQTLGVPVDTVSVVQGDTDSCPYTGYGTGASRGASIGGATTRAAALELREKIIRVAGALLEADPRDLELRDGTVSVAGAPTRSVTMKQIGDASYRRLLGKLPEDEIPVLEGRKVFEPENVAFSNGCSVAMMEVDRETGRAEVLGYIVAHDCGTVINPMLVDGQVHGGAAQGIGGALYEEITYEDGIPQVGGLFDYLVPSAADLPRIATRHIETPATAVPGGFKGVGECGTIGAASAVCAAIEDALTGLDVAITTIPVTPTRLHKQIVAAERRSA